MMSKSINSVNLAKVMNVYIGERQSGKSTALIKISAETHAVIVCATYHQAQYLAKLAIRMGVEIPMPISFDQYLTRITHYRFRFSNIKYLIDEAQTIFRYLGVLAMTLGEEGVNVIELPTFYEDCDEKGIQEDEVEKQK